MKNQIVIERLNNGWVVSLPFPESYPGDGGPIMNEKFFNTMVAAGKAIRGDDEIDQLRGKQSHDPVDTVSIDKAENIFTFKTFKEVTEFLKYKIVE